MSRAARLRATGFRPDIVMLSVFTHRAKGPLTGPRCSSVSPLRVPVSILFLLCLRYQLEHTAHPMELLLNLLKAQAPLLSIILEY